MLSKIISGGQTGADQAALDSAIKFNIEYGGWIPKGRKTESGVLSDKYKMDEMETADYPARTRQNIIDSDATLIVAGNSLTGGSRLTKKIAMELGKPYCHIDYISMDEFEAAMVVHSFIVDNNIEVLNVAGPRLSSDNAIYAGTRAIIESMIYMVELSSDDGIGKIDLDDSDDKNIHKVESMESAVKMFESILDLKTKIEIASLDNTKIVSLYHELYDYIMDKFIFNTENAFLFKEFVSKEGNILYKTRNFLEPEFVIEAGDFVMALVKALKKYLEKEYLLRVIK